MCSRCKHAVHQLICAILVRCARALLRVHVCARLFRQRTGAKIQCTSCYTAYHPLCARIAGLHMEIMDGSEANPDAPVSAAPPLLAFTCRVESSLGVLKIKAEGFKANAIPDVLVSAAPSASLFICPVQAWAVAVCLFGVLAKGKLLAIYLTRPVVIVSWLPHARLVVHVRCLANPGPACWDTISRMPEKRWSIGCAASCKQERA